MKHLEKCLSPIASAVILSFSLAGGQAFAALTITNASFEADGTTSSSQPISSWSEELASANGTSEQALFEGANANIPSTSAGTMWGHLVDKNNGNKPAIYQNLGTWNTGDATSYALTATLGVRSNRPFAALDIEFYSVSTGAAGLGAADGTTFAAAFTSGTMALDSDTTITLNGGGGTATAAYSNTFDLSGINDTDDVWIRIGINTLTPGTERHSLIDDLAITAVPEPSSLALLGLGGLALTLRRRRK